MIYLSLKPLVKVEKHNGERKKCKLHNTSHVEWIMLCFYAEKKMFLKGYIHRNN